MNPRLKQIAHLFFYHTKTIRKAHRHILRIILLQCIIIIPPSLLGGYLHLLRKTA